jgi:sulfide:quinone oxidoreductase
MRGGGAAGTLIRMAPEPLRVVIAGGGVAGLEALFALRALAGERVALTLVAPQEDFVYRPLAVAEPFALGAARRTPLAAATREVDAELIVAGVTAVDGSERTAALDDGRQVEYDALLLATGADAEPAFQHAMTWTDRSGVDAIGGLMRDLEEGYSGSLAVVIPPGPGWPLPGYELALLMSRQARGMAMEPRVTLITPEQAPLAVFGPRASEAMRDELDQAGVRIEVGAYAEVRRGTVALRPSGRTIAADRIVALPRLRGRPPRGVPASPEGFIAVDEHCRVVGAERLWAAGDGIDFPVKFGGLAAGQADTAAADIAADAGALVERTPFRPVLRGRLLTGRRDRFVRFDAGGGGGEGETGHHALWWPPGKIAGRWLAPWLAERDDDAVARQLPEVGGLHVQTDLLRNVLAG